MEAPTPTEDHKGGGVSEVELEEVQSDLIALKKLYGLLQSKGSILQLSRSEDLDDKSRQLLKKLLDSAAQHAFQSHSKVISEKSSASGLPGPKHLPTPPQSLELPEKMKPFKTENPESGQDPNSNPTGVSQGKDEGQKRLKRALTKTSCHKSDLKRQISAKEKMQVPKRSHQNHHRHHQRHHHSPKKGPEKELLESKEAAEGPITEIRLSTSILGLLPTSEQKKEKEVSVTISEEAAMAIRRIDDLLPADPVLSRKVEESPSQVLSHKRSRREKTDQASQSQNESVEQGRMTQMIGPTYSKRGPPQSGTLEVDKMSTQIGRLVLTGNDEINKQPLVVGPTSVNGGPHITDRKRDEEKNTTDEMSRKKEKEGPHSNKLRSGRIGSSGPSAPVRAMSRTGVDLSLDHVLPRQVTSRLTLQESDKSKGEVGPILEKSRSHISKSSGPVKAHDLKIDRRDPHQMKRMPRQRRIKGVPAPTKCKQIQVSSCTTTGSSSSQTTPPHSSQMSSSSLTPSQCPRRRLSHHVVGPKAKLQRDERMPRRTMTYQVGPSPPAKGREEERDVRWVQRHRPVAVEPHRRVRPASKTSKSDHCGVGEKEGRLRRLKKKLGYVFHHHHHHHHHHHLGQSGHDDEAQALDHHHHLSFWRYLGDMMLHRTSKEKHVKVGAEVQGERAVGKAMVRSMTSKRQQKKQGMVERVVRHVWQRRKRSGAEKRSCRGKKKVHWWQWLHRRKRGVKLTNRKKKRLLLRFRRSKNKTS